MHESKASYWGKKSDRDESTQDEHGKNAALLHIYNSVLPWSDFSFYIFIYLLPVNSDQKIKLHPAVSIRKP